MLGIHPKLRKGLKQRILIFDGAMGTEILKRGMLRPGMAPELLNLEARDKIAQIHGAYRKAGSNVATTNTFGANRIKLAHFSLEEKVEDLNAAAVRAARQGSGADSLVAGSVGPLGEFLQPLGPLSWTNAVEAFAQQIKALRGCDLLLLETFSDIHELRAAAFAARTTINLPVIACAALEDDGSLLTGGDVCSLATALEDLDVFGLGLNCGLGPKELAPFAEELCKSTSLPILVQGNCGLPDDSEGSHRMSPEDFAKECGALIRAGVNMIGGCCGSRAEHVQELALSAANAKPRSFSHNNEGPLRVGGRGSTVLISKDRGITVIGERINPTGRSSFAKKLRANDLSWVRRDALAQASAGAHILDVNVGTSGVDEVDLLPKAVSEATTAMLPICIDSSNPLAIEKALELTPGKALINSASAEETRLNAVMDLAQRFGAAVICLPVDQDGVAATTKERIRILEKIVRRAKHKRVARKNLLLDGLVTSLAADPLAAKVSAETIAAIETHFNLPSVLGLGNISHGLPGRSVLTANFLAMARARGLCAAIVNPLKREIADGLRALNALTNGVESLKSYTKHFKAAAPEPKNKTVVDDHEKLRQALIQGSREIARKLVIELLEQGNEPRSLLERDLVPAMDEVGRLFADRQIYLPGLIAAAESMETASKPIKEALEEQRECNETQQLAPLVLLATVEGDVHDIGKNIVRLVLRNSGYRVLDLGKDVNTNTIIDRAIEEEVDLIALSALMTTTMVNMKKVANEIKRRGLDIPLLIGGAVLSENYASSIGAHYCPDAPSAPSFVAKLMGDYSDSPK